MVSLAYESALTLADRIKKRELSSRAVTELYINRIEKYDPDVNAVVVRTFEDALDRADEADRAAAGGLDLGPLHGVPMTIKESYALAGTPVTWGNEDFRDNISARDGLAVSRFRQAGALFLGKTNVPKDLADFQSYNAIFGTTGNPYDVSRTPGGSSGGSAASLAAGFCALEAGSDIGGSIRNPAHFCGVYGHKPTYGIVPMRGHELLPGTPQRDLAVCGPLARTPEDLKVALDVMAGPDEREATGWTLDLPSADFGDLKALKVALWGTDEVAPVSSEITERVLEVGELLSGLGARVSDAARPDMDLMAAHRNYQMLLASVMASAMTDEEAVRAKERADALDPEDRSSDAVNLRARVMSHRQWMRANTAREHLRRAWDRFFEDWDILVCPQMATVAFPHDHRPFSRRTLMVDGDEQPYFKQLFWAGMVVNAYLPSTVFPTGLSREGLPIGLQAVSAPYRDHRTIEFTRQLAGHMGGFSPPAHLAE